MTPATPRPRIDPAFYRPSHPMAVLYFVYALALFTLPGYASYSVAVGAWPLVLKIVVMVPLTILSGYGLNMLGFVGHEGMHGNLFRNRTASAIFGLFSASAVLTYFEMGFAMSHWNHHRYTNQAGDPDIPPVRGLRTWWQRLLLSRPIYNTLYFKYALGMALGRPIPFKYKMAYPFTLQVWFARLNFVFAAMWLAVYVVVTVWNWRLGLFAIGLPLLAVMMIGATQTYQDHAGVGDGIFQNARSRTSWGMTLLFFGANYHMEHHAYPAVPCYRLPKLHRHLKTIGAFDQLETAHDPSFFGVFRSVALPYTEGHLAPDFDAFERAVEATSGEPEDARAATANRADATA